MKTKEFDEIRPYDDDELPAVFEELIADPDFRKIISVAYPDVPFNLIADKMRACKTKIEFQIAFSAAFLHIIAGKHTDGLTLDTTVLKDREQAYTYISNHRDIILDSGFLSILLNAEGLDTVEIAIGDNLLIYPWIKKLVRINKSFIVQRGLTMRQVLESSARMSRYIHHTIREKKQSVWIAQREGRAKDSDDRTQESLLKMLAMGGKGDIAESLSEINIVPLSISYEYDPCDYLKAEEFQLKRDIKDYRKTTQDDLNNMQTGLFGYKGRVHFHMGACINEELGKLDTGMSKNRLYQQIAELIDRSIHRNYRLYPANYIAHDLLEQSDAFSSHYTVEDKERFRQYMEKQLGKIQRTEKDMPYLRGKMLLMYANPLRNHLAAL